MTIYDQFRRWRYDGTIECLHDKLRDQARQKQGRAVSPSAAVLDSQTVKAGEKGPPGTLGYDSDKKIKGRRRHLMVDRQGFLLIV